MWIILQYDESNFDNEMNVIIYSMLNVHTQKYTKNTQIYLERDSQWVRLRVREIQKYLIR